MTYKAYITTALLKFNLSESEIDLIILDNGLTAESVVDPSIAKIAIHKSLTIWLPVNSSVSEGGVSIGWDQKAIEVYYAALCKELGLDNVISGSRNSIRDKSNLW